MASEGKKEYGEEEQVEQSPRASIATAETYLNLLLRNVLRQIADNDLAVTVGSNSLGRGGLYASATGRLGVLLDTTHGRGRVGASSGATGGAATASAAALGRGDVVKGLVELSRHCDGVEKWLDEGRVIRLRWMSDDVDRCWSGLSRRRISRSYRAVCIVFRDVHERRRDKKLGPGTLSEESQGLGSK